MTVESEREPLEALQVLGVVPGHSAVDPDDTFGRDRGDDAADHTATLNEIAG